MEWVKLEDCFEFIRNGANIKQFGSEGLPITRIETISDRTVNKEKVGYATIKYPQYSEYYLKYNDILMSHINSASHLGKVAIYKDKSDETLIHGMNLLCLRSNENFLADYLYYFFNSIIFKHQINKIMKKSVNQASFNITNLKNLKVPNISISKQKNIVEKLSKVENLIQTRQDQIQALDDLVYSAFYNVFGDPASSSNSNKFVKLSDIGKWKSGGTPLRSNHDYYNGSIPWVTSGELNKIYIDDSLEHITEQAIEESSAKLVEPGSLLLGMYDSAGLKSSITTKEMATNQAIAFSKIDSNIANSIFVYTCIQILRPILLTKQRGVRQKNFNLTMIRNIKIILPPIEKQNQFAAFVEKIEKQKQILSDSLGDLTNLFDSLMQDAFDGSVTK